MNYYQKLDEVFLCEEYSNTIWITGNGKIIDVPSGQEHTEFIQYNFEKLFPNQDKNIYEIPFQNGWVRVNGELEYISFEGDWYGVKKNKNSIMKIIDDRLMRQPRFTVWMEFTSWMEPRVINRNVDKKFYLPEEYDDLRDFL